MSANFWLIKRIRVLGYAAQFERKLALRLKETQVIRIPRIIRDLETKTNRIETRRLRKGNAK